MDRISARLDAAGTAPWRVYRRLFFLQCAACVLFLCVACKPKAPVITAIDPNIGMMGEVISIAGEGFGAEQEDSYITVGGQEPTSSSYLEWTDELIRVRLPEFGSAGLVYVHKGDQRSNPALFSDRAAIPSQPPAAVTGSGPHIDVVKPESASAGALVTIQGAGFGSLRETGSVRFHWEAESPSGSAFVAPILSIEPFDRELGYELWSSDEIRVHVPDGASSGKIEVSTPYGVSTPVLFTVNQTQGAKTFKDKRTWTISYSINIQIHNADLPNTLYLWSPRPVYSSSQPKVELISCDREPFVEDYRGTVLFQLKDSLPQTSVSINLSYVVDVYAVETAIDARTVRSSSSLPASYTQNTPLIPSDADVVAELAASITGRERNPYTKARLIYEWLIQNADIRRSTLAANNSVLDAIEQKRADSYSASLLFCALSRASGIPSIPVAGVLIDSRRAARPHYWAEFWIEGFGWTPVDPALGAGAVPETFALREDAAAWYFGNMDNQRIAFSRGSTPLSQMDPRGRLATRRPDYALQDFWEEAVGGITSYSSVWSDIAITGMFME